MTLIDTKRAATTLVIIPITHGNLAKYISGVNNAKEKNTNVASIRYSVNDRIVVLLYARRRIEKGEILKYNYNGALDLYPTTDFI